MFPLGAVNIIPLAVNASTVSNEPVAPVTLPLELIWLEAVMLVICNLFQNLLLLPKLRVPLVEGKKLDVCCPIAALSAAKVSIFAVPSINKSFHSLVDEPKL